MFQRSGTNQKGFSAFEAIALILILGIIGGVGYYVYGVNKNATKTLSIASQETKSSTQKTVAKKSTTASAATQYLVIKEWGVRMQLSTKMSDAYYEFKPNLTNDAYLSTKSLVALAPACAPLGTSIGAIFRQTVAEHDASMSSPSDGNPTGDIKIGDYYYGFISAQAGCFEDTNTAAQALLDSVQPRQGFATAEKTLEAVPAN